MAGVQSGLWAVEGGNKLVCSRLLESAKVRVIHNMVTSISLEQSGNKGKPFTCRRNQITLKLHANNC